jgi:hypothetical protein
VAAMGWNVEFKVRLQGILGEQWYELASKLNGVVLNGERDKAEWIWTNNRKFSVKSIYNFLSKDECGSSYDRIWKAKIPEKIMIFMWLIEQEVILAKDNMRKKNWSDDPGCYFCGAEETIDHMMFSCPVAKVVWGVVALCFHQKDRPSCYKQYWPWVKKALLGGDKMYTFGVAADCWAMKARNSICFEKKMLNSPFDIVFSACSLMRY